MYRFLIAVFVLYLAATHSYAQSEPQKPNVILILADDLGYGDLSCYGAGDIATPNIDGMATEGAKFDSFYVSSVCSETRAALMTGCVAQRVGIGGVMFPRNNHGLNPDEITLPELLKDQCYATAIIGKWHLGNQDMFQPLSHWFEYCLGTPSSNSQGFYPTLKQYAADCVFREGYTCENILELDEAKCPLLRNNVVIEVPADQTHFTQRYTRQTIRFITEHKDKPFFVYKRRRKHSMAAPSSRSHWSGCKAYEMRRSVYGRLSDSGLGKKDWDHIRAVQKKLGESGPRSTWINTGDLNDDLKPNDLHYSGRGSQLLAERFARKAIELVVNKEQEGKQRQ